MADIYGSLSVRLKDSNGVTVPAQLLVKSPEASSLTAIIAAAQAYFALLDPITDAAGVIARVTFKFPSTGLKTSTSVVNAVDTTGLFDFGDGSTGDIFGVDVPAFAEALITNGKPKLDDEDFIAWQTWVRTGLTALVPVTRKRLIPTGFLAGRLATRKHRKSLTKVSYTPGT
jgi:hypothetical protein